MAPRRRVAVALAAASALLVLAGCSSSDAVADAANNPDAGYVVSGSGAEWWDPDARADAADFSSEVTTDGNAVDSAELRGKVVVLNFWYATCPPCRTEAPLLDTVAGEYSSDDVVFVGVNVRDDVATANAFEKTFDVPYPSVLDADIGDVQLAYSTVVPPGATPSTLVIDKEGRVAARMLGELESASQLGGYVDAALEEQ